MPLADGALMIERMNTTKLFMEQRHISRITDIGIAARRISGDHELAIGDDFTVGHCPVGSVFDIPHLTDGYLIAVHHLTTDMRQGGLLADHIAATGHTMLQGNALYHDAAIFIDHTANRRIYWVEHHLEPQVMCKELDLSFEFRTQSLWCMDMQASRTPQQTEGGDHANESEAVVTMQMGDKHMAELREAHSAFTQLHLRALGTIKHQHLVTHLNHL